MQNGRCRMHGGKSLSWFAHPNYKHGLYSKYSPEGIFFNAEKKRRKHLRERIRMVKAMSTDELCAEMKRIFGRKTNMTLPPQEFRELLLQACERGL